MRPCSQDYTIFLYDRLYPIVLEITFMYFLWFFFKIYDVSVNMTMSVNLLCLSNPRGLEVKNW